MRRKDREIADLNRIEEIVRRCEVASIAFGGGSPYVIPMSYGFVREGDQFTLYMHGAVMGEKIERIKRDPRAAFTMFTGNAVYGEGAACEYSTRFDSVCGSGRIRLLESDEEKRAGLEIIMEHYAPGEMLVFSEKMVHATCVMELVVAEITGKHHD